MVLMTEIAGIKKSYKNLTLWHTKASANAATYENTMPISTRTEEISMTFQNSEVALICPSLTKTSMGEGKISGNPTMMAANHQRPNQNNTMSVYLRIFFMDDQGT